MGELAVLRSVVIFVALTVVALAGYATMAKLQMSAPPSADGKPLVAASLSLLASMLAIEAGVWGVVLTLLRGEALATRRREVRQLLDYLVGYLAWTSCALMLLLLSQYFNLKPVALACGVTGSIVLSLLFLPGYTARKL